MNLLLLCRIESAADDDEDDEQRQRHDLLLVDLVDRTWQNRSDQDWGTHFRIVYIDTSIN